MEENSAPKSYGRIVFPGWESTAIDKPNTIARIEGDSNYSIVHLKCGHRHRYPVCLDWIEAQLDPEQFFRIHKSHIISGNWVTRYRPDGERYRVEFKSGDPLYVSRKRRDDFEKFIKPFIPFGYKRRKNKNRHILRTSFVYA
jgi:two-component system, LytTR family, response regulator